MNTKNSHFFMRRTPLIAIALLALFSINDSYAKKSKRSAKKFPRKTKRQAKAADEPSKVRQFFGFKKTVAQQKKDAAKKRAERHAKRFAKQEKKRKNTNTCPLTESRKKYPASDLSSQVSAGFQEGENQTRKETSDKLRTAGIVVGLRTCTLNKISDEFIRAQKKARKNMQPLINNKINKECNQGITKVNDMIAVKELFLKQSLKNDATHLYHSLPKKTNEEKKDALQAKSKLDAFKNKFATRLNKALNKARRDVHASIEKTRQTLLRTLKVY